MVERYAISQYEQAARLLPVRWQRIALQLPDWQKEQAEELRLRAGHPMTVLLPRGEQVVGEEAVVTQGDIELLCDTVTGYLRKKRTAHTLYRKSEISVFNGAFMSHVHKFCKELFRFLGRLFFHYRIDIRRRITKFCGTCDNNLRFGRISKKFDSHFHSSADKKRRLLYIIIYSILYHITRNMAIAERKFIRKNIYPNRKFAFGSDKKSLKVWI